MLSNEIYTPLFVGAINKKSYGYLRDDTGENISEKNNQYSETTGLYWIWKNSDADIIGLCHYRRYFVKGKFGNGDYLDYNTIINDLKEYDIIAYKMKLGKTVYESFNIDISEENIEISKRVMKNFYGDYYEDYLKTLNGREFYAKSMFIGKREFVDEYCEWLFPFLKELESYLNFKIDTRLVGYFAELCLNVYLIHNNLNVKTYKIRNIEARSNMLMNFIESSHILGYIYRSKFSSFLYHDIYKKII